MADKSCNDFVTKLKAHGSNKDFCDLAAAHKEYHDVLIKLPTKEKATFSLNVLCILCRNLEKVPSWRQCIENQDLLKLCIDCLRHTRGVTGDVQVKTLAAVYHVHRYIVRQNASSIPPELVLKLSIMPFESDVPYLLTEYHKTYWSILADRINYIEKLKPMKIAIVKLLPKLNEDLTKLIQIYTDRLDFCTNILPFVVKKLNQIYANTESLIRTYQVVFNNIKSYNLSELKDATIDEIYMKFSECIYVIADMSSKSDFKDSPLDDIVRTCLSLLGHRPDIFHCLQTFYLNSFIYVFNRPKEAENVFRNILVSCETTEKLGYKSIMYKTYPYINQLMRLCIEYYHRQRIDLNEHCLNLIIYLMEKAKVCKQIVKCENCTFNSGYHDALRLSFLVKNIINTNTKVELVYAIIDRQFDIVKMLSKCANHVKYYAKLIADTHNTAIQYYKSLKYENAIHLFDYCINNESDHKNVCRALYNKSICEADNRMYEAALKDGYLSMVFDNAQNLEKYMSLVLDVKGKAANDADNVDLQLMSVLDACNRCDYDNLLPMLRTVKFSELLKQELSIYVKLWPSLVPIVGVIKSLNCMILDEHHWILAEDREMLKSTLYDVLLRTPGVVRTIQQVNFRGILKDILGRMEYDKLSLDEKVVFVALSMMKSEHDLQEASDKHGWKQTDQSFDPGKSTVYKSVLDEYNASKDSIRAVELLTTLKSEIKNVSPSLLPHLLRLCEVTIFQLLHLERNTHALQLAHVGLRLANAVGDKVSFIRCSGVLLSHAPNEQAQFNAIAVNAVKVCPRLLADGQAAEAALVFLCELGMYHVRCKKSPIAARLLRKAEQCAADLFDVYPNIDLELAIGRIMELGAMLSDMSRLSAVNIIQRHYLAAQPTETTWLLRRRGQLQIRFLIQQSSVTCASVCRRLKLWRRARTAVGAALTPSGAAVHGRLFALACDTCRPDDAKVKIENRLKYILGLTREVRHHVDAKTTPLKTFNYENVEVSLNCLTVDRSPTNSYASVPAFDVPPFLAHAQCSCAACSVPACAILACTTASLEASVYFRSKERRIARNYFDGAEQTFELAKRKLNSVFDSSKTEGYIVDAVRARYKDELSTVEADFLIERAFFELSNGDVGGARRSIDRVRGLSDHTDDYVRSDISNLMIAAHELSKPRRVQRSLEVEFDNLKLSEAPRTPEGKAMPQMASPKIVRDEEVPKRKKAINKLDFDKQETPQPPKAKFKVPELKLSRPQVETPRPRARQVPESPQEFFTPKSPDEFFTPLTKTYLRRNGQAEFLTPSEAKRSLRKKTLLRATSPGKVGGTVTRSRRVKQPNFDE